MNEQLNNDTTQGDHHSAIEGQAFWQSHIDQYQQAKLSRKAYCRKHKLNYNRFQYWFHKLSSQRTRHSKAIPIQLKQNAQQSTQRVLCTLDCGPGKRLLIHDISVVTQVMARLP